MTLTCTSPDNGFERANKIFVNTNYSLDGRTFDSFWVGYNPKDTFALFLLEYALKNAPGVESYTVFDSNGVRIRRYTPETESQPNSN